MVLVNLNSPTLIPNNQDVDEDEDEDSMTTTTNDNGNSQERWLSSSKARSLPHKQTSNLFLVFNKPLPTLQDQIVMFNPHSSYQPTLNTLHRQHHRQPNTAVSLQLSFTVFNRTITLHLEKNADLFDTSPSGVQVVDEHNRVLSHLSHHSHPAYKGHAVILTHHGVWQPVGMARIMFMSSNIFGIAGEPAPFEGFFTVYGHTYHVKQVNSYRRARWDVDADLASPYSRPEHQRRSQLIAVVDDSGLFSKSVSANKHGMKDGNWLKDGDLLQEQHALETDASFYWPRSRGWQMTRMSNDASATCNGSGLCRRSDASSGSEGSGSSSTFTQAAFACGHDQVMRDMNLNATRAYNLELNAAQHLHKRQQLTGCPTSRRILPMAVVADCTYVRSYGGQTAALNAILADWNSASQAYESTFNVSLGIIKVQLQSICSPASDPTTPWNQECSASYTINQRLSDFSKWRGQNTSDSAGLWHLMTQCSTGAAVGVAWVSMLCAKSAYTEQNANGEPGTSYVSGTGVSSIVPVEWKVVAHEIGHNFGAIHDCTASNGLCPGCTSASCGCCPCAPGCDCEGKFLMNPTDDASTDAFSACSQRLICANYAQQGTCLQAPGAFATLSAGICGNGVKEAGEECDCGTTADCAGDPCCNGTTCKLKAGSVCDDRNDDCCANCQFKSSGTVCRPSTGDCDTTLYCNGTSGTCPFDNLKPDGTSCTTGDTTANCASGVCTSRKLQCTGRTVITTVDGCAGQTYNCALLCQDARGTCYQINGNFIDGTPCGIAGKCYSGTCQSSNFIDKIVLWVQSSPGIAIPVLIVAAIVVVSLVGLVYRVVAGWCMRRRRRPSAAPSQQQRAGSSVPASASARSSYATPMFRASAPPQPPPHVMPQRSSHVSDPSRHLLQGGYAPSVDSRRSTAAAMSQQQGLPPPPAYYSAEAHPLTRNSRQYPGSRQ